MLLPLLPALLAALAPSLEPEETPTPPLPVNSSAPFASKAALPTAGARERARATPLPPPPPREDPPCNISVQRQMLSSLLVRWSPLALAAQCDLVLFSTGGGGGGGGGAGGGGRAFFSAAFPRVGPPPLLIEHLGLAAGGVQQELRLCVGCSWARGRRVGRLRPAASPAASPPSSSSSALFSSSSAPLPPEQPAAPWQQGERLHFCCLDFSLEELKGDPGWRLNRKPIESTLVACFMTLVIIVWSVAALIWPVPIIAGFLPNGMEQRRGANAAAGPGSNSHATAGAAAAAAGGGGGANAAAGGAPK